MKEKGKDKVSIANILALVGLAGIASVTFFGQLLHSNDGSLGGAVIAAVAFLAGLALLLFMSIKAKGMEDNREKWRFVEWGCLVAYVAVAVLFAKPFQRFFFVMQEQSEWKQQAQEEINAINNLYDSYDAQRSKFINDAAEQLKNYMSSSQQGRYSDPLADYAEIVNGNVDSWAAKAESITKIARDGELKKLQKDINSWNVMKMASIASSLSKLEDKIWQKTENKIREFEEENYLIPVITGGYDSPYRQDGYAKFDLGKKPEPIFANKLRNSDGNTTLGWILYAALHLLVLLNYLVTKSPTSTGPRLGSLKGHGDKL